MRLFRNLALLAALCSPLLAGAQPWPSKPIRVVVPFAVGSGTDIITRVVIDEMQRNMGGNFIVDNKPGASGQIAADLVAKAPPDGYTIFMGTNTAMAANPHLFKKLSYDPIKDFTPIARVNYFVFVLAVNGASPVKTPKELVERAKASPNGLNYGHGNSTGQVAGAHFVHGSGIKATVIPYKSTPPALTDLSGGQIDFMFVDVAASQTFSKSGRIRWIAVQSDQRSSLVPELPPVGDTVPGYSFVAWGGLFGPAGLPRDIVVKLHAEVGKALGSATVKEKMAAQGLEPAPMGVDEFPRYVTDQLVLWGQRIRAAGMEPE